MTGPDGNLWLTASCPTACTTLGVLTTSGKLRYFKPPIADLAVVDLADGAGDGNLWLTAVHLSGPPSWVAKIQVVA
jgi:hypothetical protein